MKHVRSAGGIASTAVIGMLLAGCASNPTPGEAYDPLESANRNVYQFNQGFDTYLLAPVARGWTAITTEGVRVHVGNFFDNAAYPGVILNDYLQGKPERATAGIGRFLMNTTVGLAGVFDPASTFGIPDASEDFGQTLGVWGASSGAYLTIPLLGPSNARDVTRYPVGYFTDVLTYVATNAATFGAVTALNVVNRRAQLEGAARIRDEAAVDPYIFTRSAYSQARYSQIYDGNPPEPAEDPYADYFENQDTGSDDSPESEQSQ